jgi:hypothetical protein
VRVVVRKKEKPKETAPAVPAAPVEAKQEAKQQQPTGKAKPRTPSVKRITYEYFEKFNPDNRNRKSWVKETLEIAAKEPIMVRNLTRGQIMALINQVDRHNMNSDRKIVYKYDVKRGIVLLAPKDSLIARLRQQKEGEQ